MTHEQKPESAEFRTREAQVDEIHDATAKAVCRGRKDYTPEIYRTYLGVQILEAEARGAAWQRESDSEDNEVAGWQAFECGRGWFDITKDKLPLYGESVRPLYTRPANVAALEARAVELEGTLRNVRAAIEQADPKVLFCTLWMPGQPETVVDYISAAIREGGEHG